MPTSFEEFRAVTGWQRPGRSHGCAPVEIVPGLWTAHYHDIDSVEKIKSATKGAPISLVVNSAVCQCEARTGFWGPSVRVMCVELEDDPDERKLFDKGTAGCQSACADASVAAVKRCAGSARTRFEEVNREIAAELARGGQVLVHCHASLSRSVAFLLAYLMKSRKCSLLQAAQLFKPKWDACWPCDRFAYELVEYEQYLRAPWRLESKELLGMLSAAALLGALAGAHLAKRN